MRIAVVGSGISGLTAAYRLREFHDVHVFEADGRPGGHSHTVPVTQDGCETGLDTGFLVYNETTYPGFTALLQELGVETQRSSMTLSVSCRECGFSYASQGLRRMLASGIGLLKPARIGLLRDLRRFIMQANGLLAAGAGDDRSVSEWLAAERYGLEFRRHFIVPLVASIWSTPARNVGDFPLLFLLRFMANHGLIGLNKGLEWRTVHGGSRNYVSRMVDALPHGVHLNARIDSVTRYANGAVLRLQDGNALPFDKIILACHSDQALALLSDPAESERAALRSITYSASSVLLHTDKRVMPRRRHLWSSWNYHPNACADDWQPVSLSYYLNRLQQLETVTDYFVSVNPQVLVDPAKVVHRMSYAHPEYTRHAVAAQAVLRATNGQQHTYYAGAYMGHGFHEDGYRSGAAAAEAILGSSRVHPSTADAWL